MQSGRFSVNFNVRLDHRPTEWRDHLILFVGYLVPNRYQSATVKSYISAIKAFLKEDGVKVTEDQYTLVSLGLGMQTKE